MKFFGFTIGIATPSDAAAILGKRGAAVRKANERGRVLAKARQIRAEKGLPPLKVLESTRTPVRLDGQDAGTDWVYPGRRSLRRPLPADQTGTFPGKGAMPGSGWKPRILKHRRRECAG